MQVPTPRMDTRPSRVEGPVAYAIGLPAFPMPLQATSQCALPRSKPRARGSVNMLHLMRYSSVQLQPLVEPQPSQT